MSTETQEQIEAELAALAAKETALKIELLVAGMPSTSPPPVNLNDSLGLTEAELAANGIHITDEPVKQNWCPANGAEISLMLRAISAGLVRQPGVPITQAEVQAFLDSKGL